MARPLRIERAGAWHHVTARGLERRAIYRDDKDRAHWLELLAEAVDLWRLVVHGYVMMENQRSYQRYVEEAVREGLPESPWEQLKGQLYLGSQQAWEKLRKTVKAGTREQPLGRSLGRRPSFAEVISVVEELKEAKWENIRDRRGDWGRELALYLGRRLSVMKLRELGQEIGGADYAAVSVAIKRFEGRLRADKKMAQIVQQARSRLMERSNVEC